MTREQEGLSSAVDWMFVSSQIFIFNPNLKVIMLGGGSLGCDYVTVSQVSIAVTNTSSD
jgi:hypothetical protein